MSIKKINKQDFKDWLRRKPGFTTVGYAVKAGSCPIAQFYREMGASSSSVGLRDLRFVDENGNDKKHQLPVWCKAFIRYIDDMHIASERVTAEVARDVLERVA